MHIALFAPASRGTPTGSLSYDRRVVAALDAAGHPAALHEIPGAHPLADAAAQDAARRALSQLPETTVPLLDGGVLTACLPWRGELAARRAAVLMHRPVSVERGLPADDAARLHAAEHDMFVGPAGGLRIIATSAAARDLIAAEHGVQAEQIAVVPPGIDHLAPAHGSPPGTGCAILALGAQVPRKGHDVLLRALARLFDLEWHLTICGTAEADPAHAQALAARAEQLGIAARVRRCTADDPATLESLWQAADVFALASWWDGYGLAVAEALRRGLPIAACAGGGIASLVTPATGVLAPPGDDEALSKAMRRVIFDAGLRAEMARAALQAGAALPDWPTQAAALAAALL